jgi:hypothetical protein
MVSLLQACEKEAMKRGDQYVASELFLVALSEAKSGFAGAWAWRMGARMRRKAVIFGAFMVFSASNVKE